MKILFLSIILIVFYQGIFAQYTTIKTPTGVIVEAIYFAEFNSDELAKAETQAANWIKDNYSNAVRVSPASKTYNCHDYAWHYSDGGTKVWVNQTDKYGNANLSKYWSGNLPTYQATTISKANKAFYPDGDHSAKIISTNVFESKWGAWPRYRHSPSDCPYISSNIKYYAVLTPTGSSVICSSESYSGLNISGASYSWTGDKVSMSGSGSTGTAIKTSDGEGWIKTNIYSPYSGTTVSAKKVIWAGNPDQPTTNPSGYPTVQLGLGSILTIRVSKAPGAIGSNYTWDITGSIQKMGGNGSTCVAEAASYGSGNYRVKTSNKCGLSFSGGGAVYVKKNGSGWPMMVSLFPNPAKSVLNVELVQRDIEQNSIYNANEAKEIFIYDKQNKLLRHEKMEGNSKQINLNGLKPDLYFIKIKIGEDIHSEKLMISR